MDATVKELSIAHSSQFAFIAEDTSSLGDLKRSFRLLDDSPNVLVNNTGHLAAPSTFTELDNLDYYGDIFRPMTTERQQPHSFYLRHRKGVHATSLGVIITLNTMGAYSVRVPRLSAHGSRSGSHDGACCS